MNARVNELSHFGDSILWLSKEDSLDAYNVSIKYTDDHRYGLNESYVDGIEQFDASGNKTVVDAWLATRCSGQMVRVIFGPDEVFDSALTFFLANWRDIFCPSRDDALIVSINEDWVLFYCHEDELEFGCTKV